MASIVAHLPPPLLVHGRKNVFRTPQKLPISSIKDRQNGVAVTVKATGEGSESSTSLSIVKSFKNVVLRSKPVMESVRRSRIPFLCRFFLSFVLYFTLRSSFHLLWDRKSWGDSEDRLALVGLGFAAIVALWASANVITAIDKLPLLPSFLEFVGILFSSWFIYRYLLFKPDREELFQIVNKSISDILGQ